ncbi:hypothetical protein Q1695_013946 [Nippostrongylus brasiliensis]|nr:hypothetical protein Q1695_013946 [Nippostrongylus brasiliensis]
MIGAGVGAASVTLFNPDTPAEVIVPGFTNGKRFRVVIVPTEGASRFAINFRTQGDLALHFNPRFDENTVVCNSTHNDHWQQEQRTSLPLKHGRVYTLEFVAQYGHIQIHLNGAPFMEFAERLPGSEIHAIEVTGDVHVHSAHVE